MMWGWYGEKAAEEIERLQLEVTGLSLSLEQQTPPPSSHVVGWQLQAHEVIQEVLRYNAACPNLPGDIIERLRRLDRTATTEGSNNG